MAILSNSPITINGVTYDRFGVNLVISPAWKDADIGPNLVLKLERYTKDADGNVLRIPVDPETGEDHSLSLTYSSWTIPDTEIEAKVRELMTFVQDVVNLKGL